MKDVTAITIPDGTVKKIEDANGKVIWGSPTDFPYRRLEYLNMYGRYWNISVRPQKGYYFLNFTLNASTPLNPNDDYGVFFGCAGSSSRRLFFGINSNGIFQRLKNNANTLVASSSSLSDTIKYQIRLRTYAANNTAGTWWFGLQNLNDNSRIYGQYYNNTTYAMNLNELPYLHINAHAYNSSGTSAVPQTVVHKGAIDFKFYRFIKREDGDDSAIVWDVYPVQRKSDGVIGFYNISNNYFFPVKDAATDSNITTLTEPVADEYWDLTAPS